MGRRLRSALVVALARPAVHGDQHLAGFVDMATGNYNPESGIGIFSGIFALLSRIPAIIVLSSASTTVTNPAGGC